MIDQSTLTLLEHVNLNVPSHEHILSFYFDVLGCGMDPRKASNVLPDAPKKTLWANCGASQFHLPYGEVAQCIPGQIGLCYESLEGLQERLDECPHCYESYQVLPDGAIRIVDHYGNVFACRAKPSRAEGLQPILSPPSTDTDATSQERDIADAYGKTSTDCRGIDYVEFLCPVGTAGKIALFYESVLDATTSVVATNEGTSVAIIACGNIDEQGRADQSLLFRETTDPIPAYDGHHIALYVGTNRADFEQAFKNCELAGVVWVNPRFSDKASTLQGAKNYKQFRFKDIVDMETGEKIFELEHEMRSVEHAAYPR